MADRLTDNQNTISILTASYYADLLSFTIVKLSRSAHVNTFSIVVHYHSVLLGCIYVFTCYVYMLLDNN